MPRTKRRDSRIAELMDDARRFEVMPQSRIEELSPLARAGDIAARNEIVQGNIPLVVHLAMKHRTRDFRVSLEDIVQEGMKGLIAGVERYDKSILTKEGRPHRFGTYATYWIRDAIGALFERAPMIGIPVHLYHDNQSSQKHRDKVAGKVAAARGVMNLSDVCREDTDPLEMLSAELAYSDPAYAESQSESDHLHNTLERINSRGRFILEHYYGMNNARLLNYREIGEELGITRERVRQLRDVAIEEIRTALTFDYKTPPVELPRRAKRRIA